MTVMMMMVMTMACAGQAALPLVSGTRSMHAAAHRLRLALQLGEAPAPRLCIQHEKAAATVHRRRHRATEPGAAAAVAAALRAALLHQRQAEAAPLPENLSLLPLLAMQASGRVPSS